MKFTEEKLEKAFTELLEQVGFPHHLRITITHKPEEVVKMGSDKCLLGVTSQLCCEVTPMESIFKMSSIFTNKLDKSPIFAV